MAESGGGELIGEFFLDDLERFWEIGLAGDAAGYVHACDEVIDVWEKGFDAGIELVEIGDNGNLRSAGPLGSEGCGGGVVAVDE